jgi:hypothetical protein
VHKLVLWFFLRVLFGLFIGVCWVVVVVVPNKVLVHGCGNASDLVANSSVFHVFKISQTFLVNQTNIIKLRNKQKITSKGIKKSAIPNGEATIK